jgi:acetolactate synthase-1/2/3 large subunit
MTPMDDFMVDLAQAKRPGILVGGGAYKARKSIMQFAERCSIPVFRTWNALDVATDDSPVYCGTVGTYGGPGRNFGLQNCDLLLIIGCRISGRITGGQPQSFTRAAKRYWVDVDADLLAEHEVRPAVAVCMDAGEFVGGLLVAVDTLSRSWLDQCRSWRSHYDPVTVPMLQEFHHYGFMRRLSERLPANAIVVYDTGGNAIMMGHCFRSKEGQRIFSSNGNTPMGFALCGAIGAWFAEPTRPIICIIGDGGMQLNIQELQTIKHYDIPVKVFILNNGVLGNTKSWQRVNNRAEIACGPDGYSAPAFAAIAKAYGLPAYSLGEWSRFEHVVGAVLGMDAAAVVDVVHADHCIYEPRMSRWDTPVEEMYPYLDRAEFKKNMFIEPWKGWEEIK